MAFLVAPMTGVVVLHVGLMKSGTTFVQQQLFANRDGLESAGVVLPGRSWAAQVGGVRGALKNGDPGVWAKLATTATEHPGRSVISVELMGPMLRPQRRRLVESLRPQRVEVVVTARDLNRGMVSLWQETIQNGRTWTWPEYVAGVRAACPPAPDDILEAGRTFWRQQDLVRIVAGWAEVADRVTVVTVPHPGAPRELLLDRFAQAACLPAMAVVEGIGNESLGLASVLALREVNELLANKGLTFPQGRALRKKLLAKQVLAARRADEPSLGQDVPDWLADAAAVQVEQVRATGVELCGNWADLAPVPVPGVRVEDVAEADLRRAAVAGLAGLIEHLVLENGD